MVILLLSNYTVLCIWAPPITHICQPSNLTDLEIFYEEKWFKIPAEPMTYTVLLKD